MLLRGATLAIDPQISRLPTVLPLNQLRQDRLGEEIVAFCLAQRITVDHEPLST